MVNFKKTWLVAMIFVGTILVTGFATDMEIVGSFRDLALWDF